MSSVSTSRPRKNVGNVSVTVLPDASRTLIVSGIVTARSRQVSRQSGCHSLLVLRLPVGSTSSASVTFSHSSAPARPSTRVVSRLRLKSLT